MGLGSGGFALDRDFDARALASCDFPFTEPLIVPSSHVDGLMPRALAGTVHFAGWHLVPPMSQSAPGERRIILRFAMNEFEARALRFALGFALGEGH